ncbi:MAG: GntR family transcriptional regulator [Smithellaceae bacterium]|nr:GntR family transcriptional regulator [Smithellaceae bacterium]
MKNAATNSRRSEQLREIIEERIATGLYLPGMRLDETEMATEFGVSRTPIREALIQLSSAGLLEMRPRRGAIIAAISPQRLYEMFEVMAELEAMCVRLAVRRMTDAEIQALLEAHRACGQSQPMKYPDDYYRKNEQFHLAIYLASHNGFLIEQATALHRRLSPYRRLQLRVRDRLQASFSEHSAIVEAIIVGDGDLAAERLRKHIIIQGERFADLIASLSMLGIAEETLNQERQR